MKVVLKTEWNEKYGGAEYVNAVIGEIFVHKPACYSVYSHSEILGLTKQSVLLSKLPQLPKKIIGLFSLFHHLVGVPSSTDFLITSSFLFAHMSRIRKRNGRYLIYVHTPARYLWAPEIDNRAGTEGKFNRFAIYALKKIDKFLVNKKALFIANSHEVSRRILDAWEVPSIVINPPVDIDFFTDFLKKDRLASRTLITGGRLVPYKGHLECIKIAAQLGMKLQIAGSGPEETSLRKAATDLGAYVEFIISPSRHELASLLSQGSVFLHLAHEDFGILPLEAMATGTPVVGIAKGGLLESVNSKNGVLVDSFEDLQDAIEQALKLDRQLVSESVQRYKASNFQKRLAEVIMDKWPETVQVMSNFDQN